MSCRGKPRNRLLAIENKLMVTRGGGAGGWVKLVMGTEEGIVMSTRCSLEGWKHYIDYTVHLELMLHWMLATWNLNKNFLKNMKCQLGNTQSRWKDSNVVLTGIPGKENREWQIRCICGDSGW